MGLSCGSRLGGWQLKIRAREPGYVIGTGDASPEQK